jgi:hypothetical protein
MSQDTRNFRKTSESSGLQRIQYSCILDRRFSRPVSADYRNLLYTSHVIFRNICLGIFLLRKRVKAMLYETICV